MKILYASSLVAIAAAVSACTSPPHMSASPNVYMDSDFMALEQNGIVDALNNWDAVLDTHLADHITILSHDEILARGNQDGIVMIANHGILESEECPGNIGVPPGFAAYTYGGTTDRVMICFNVNDNDRKENIDFGVNYFAFLAGHELGHALGLYHVDDPTQIMHPQGYGPSKPTCKDAGRAAYENGWRVAPTCR